MFYHVDAADDSHSLRGLNFPKHRSSLHPPRNWCADNVQSPCSQREMFQIRCLSLSMVDHYLLIPGKIVSC